ncbi:MAG: hypothetical protein GY862_22860 [Gammaproteobacteria bacterium]|nr:hypothetical protein [Gammaproteobacteria bacterium]
MKFQHRLIGASITLILSGIIHGSAFAQSPPQPAIDACSGSSEGSSCSFQTPDGTINGSCGIAENQLACMPAGGTPPDGGIGGGMPPDDGTGGGTPPDDGTGDGTVPQPAIDACSGSSEGDSCSFQTPDGTISGSCGTAENQLACIWTLDKIACRLQ